MGWNSSWRSIPIFHEIIKGQIISKGLFGVLEFSQKTNQWIHRSSKNEFVRSFFGRIRGYQKSFRNYLTFSSMYWSFLNLFSLKRALVWLKSAPSNTMWSNYGKNSIYPFGLQNLIGMQMAASILVIILFMLNSYRISTD